MSLDSLLAIAEETLAEFLSKATGTSVEWVPLVGMKVIDYTLLLLELLSSIVTIQMLSLFLSYLENLLQWQ